MRTLQPLVSEDNGFKAHHVSDNASGLGVCAWVLVNLMFPVPYYTFSQKQI